MEILTIDGGTHLIKESIGSPLGAHDDAHAAFLAWFGDSKIVDSEGAPLLVYQTVDSSGAVARPRDIGFHLGPADRAVEVASAENGTVVPAYLALHNPLHLTEEPRIWNAEWLIKRSIPQGILSVDERQHLLEHNEEELYQARQQFQRGKKSDARWKELQASATSAVLARLREKLTEKGYDGLVYPGKAAQDAQSHVYVAFNAGQIMPAGHQGPTSAEPPTHIDVVANETLHLDGWERPTRSDRGRPIAESPEDLKAFWRWFGSSLTVDDEGRPKVMFHAGFRDLTWFDRLKSTEWRAPSMDTVGSWFSDTPGSEGAGKYASGAGAVMYPVYLAIQRPKVYESFNEFLREMHEAEGRRFEDQKPVGRGSTEGLRNKLKAQGYDGIAFMRTENKLLREKLAVYEERHEELRKQMYEAPKPERDMVHREWDRLGKIIKQTKFEIETTHYSTEFDDQYVWIAFEPTQVKSSIGNNGKFNADDPDIRASIAEYPDPLDAAVFAMVRAEAPLQQILERVASETRDHDLKSVATILGKQHLVTQLRTGRPLTDRGASVGHASLRPDATASYDEAADVAYLHQVIGATRNLLHELMHAATARALLLATSAPAQEIIALWEHARTLPAFAGEHGCSNVNEFVAEAYTSPAFREKLASTPAPGAKRSVWQSFTDSVKKCLGLSGVSESLLSKVMAAGNAMLQEPNASTASGRFSPDDIVTPGTKNESPLEANDARRRASPR